MTERKLTVESKGENELVIRREFNAPRELVYKAHTECRYLKRWLFGPDGWSLDECGMDLRVGGTYRWVWKHSETGQSMGAGGVYQVIEEPERIVCTEKFDNPWYEGEAVSSIVLNESNGVTRLENTMKYVSADARDTALRSGMDEGLSMGYDRLEGLLADLPKAAASGE